MIGFPMAFHRGQFGWLMFKCIQTMHIPTKICKGASARISHMAMENEVLTKGSRRPLIRCHAAVEATSKAETRKAAIAIWARR